MAKAIVNQLLTEEPGVTVEYFWWGWIYKGTMDALINASIAEKDWFPDGVAQNTIGKIRRNLRLHKYGLSVHVNRPAQGKCKIEFHLPDDLARLSSERENELTKVAQLQEECLAPGTDTVTNPSAKQVRLTSDAQSNLANVQRFKDRFSAISCVLSSASRQLGQIRSIQLSATRWGGQTTASAVAALSESRVPAYFGKSCGQVAESDPWSMEFCALSPGV